jgi:hypothetical protein
MPAFDRVRRIGLTLPGVEIATRYDGSPRLTLRGCFVAGLATHESAESDTLVVRVGLDQRTLLLEDAPETYYLTDYYERYPLVLARLPALADDALRDLLAMSRELTEGKAGRSRRRTINSGRR